MKNLFIGGGWVAAADGQRLPALDPSTGQEVEHLARG